MCELDCAAASVRGHDGKLTYLHVTESALALVSPVVLLSQVDEKKSSSRCHKIPAIC